MPEAHQRKEGIQRIQIGVAGLAGVVLLVGLANVVIDKVRQDSIASGELVPENTANAADTGTAAADEPNEPLAELGVTPDTDASVVADLQPDPNLKKPMDRPPPVAPTLQQAAPAEGN